MASTRDRFIKDNKTEYKSTAIYNIYTAWATRTNVRDRVTSGAFGGSIATIIDAKNKKKKSANSNTSTTYIGLYIHSNFLGL